MSPHSEVLGPKHKGSQEENIVEGREESPTTWSVRLGFRVDTWENIYRQLDIFSSTFRSAVLMPARDTNHVTSDTAASVSGAPQREDMDVVKAAHAQHPVFLTRSGRSKVFFFKRWSEVPWQEWFTRSAFLPPSSFPRNAHPHHTDSTLLSSQRWSLRFVRHPLVQAY